MATAPREPWAFDDGPQTAERILREYARWRLSTLPVLPYKPKQCDSLIEGYRRLDRARAKAGRDACAFSNPRLITTRALARNEARIAHALWDIVHRHLIAVELRRLKAETQGASDELRLVLLAERAVEKLASRNADDEKS